MIGPAVLKTEIQKLTGSIVLRALDNIGNAKLSAAIKKGGDMNGMRFTSEITRDGPGYRADLDLPWGVTPEDIMEARKPLASGLRRKVGCVWPSADPDGARGSADPVGGRQAHERDHQARLAAAEVGQRGPVQAGRVRQRPAHGRRVRHADVRLASWSAPSRAWARRS